MPINNSRNAQLQQVSAWRTLDHEKPATSDSPATSSQPPTPLIIGCASNESTVRDIRTVTCVSEMDNKDLRRALRKLELSDMSPLEAYNLWLCDYIMQGGVPTYYHDEPLEERYCRVYQDAQGVIWVANFSSGRVRGRLVFTWEHGKAVSSEPKYIPAYSNTVDKRLMEHNNSVAWRLRRSRAQWDEMFADLRARWAVAQKDIS